MLYDLCAETVVSMREQQLGMLKLLECQEFKKEKYSDEQLAILFMTL